METADQIQIYKENDYALRWYYLTGTQEEQLLPRLATLEAVQKRTQQKDFTLRLGQALEIAVSKSLRGTTAFYSMGHFKDLNEHDDSTLYSKEEPPSIIGERTISGKRKLDFVLISPTAGVVGIEVKNIREWIYVDRDEVIETLKKCVELDAVPVLIARRIAYETFSVLHDCGVIIHQTYRQRYAGADAELAELVKQKSLLGYHDVLVGNEPDERLNKFLQTNLPNILGDARKKFDEKKHLLAEYANGPMKYGEFVARVRGRAVEGPEEEDEGYEKDFYPDDYM